MTDLCIKESNFFPELREKNLIPKHSTDTPGLYNMTPIYLHSLSLQGWTLRMPSLSATTFLTQGFTPKL